MYGHLCREYLRRQALWPRRSVRGPIAGAGEWTQAVGVRSEGGMPLSERQGTRTVVSAEGPPLLGRLWNLPMVASQPDTVRVAIRVEVADRQLNRLALGVEIHSLDPQ